MTVADLIACQLRRAGVRALFGVPGGGSNLDLIAAAGRADLPFVLTATETAAAIAALAQAEITGQPGACLTTLGPGAASAVNGVACAYLDRAPLVVFTDSQSSAGGVAFEHQRLDHAALMAPITKSSEALTADNALQVLTRALHKASDERPGPVHVDCPGNVAAASTPAHGATLVGCVQHALLPADRERLEGLLRRARKPLIIAGLGARRPEVASAIRALASRQHVPAMVTYKAKGVVADEDPWFAGVFTNASIEQPILDESDLLIGLGLDPVELLPREWSCRQPIVYCGAWTVDDRHVPFAAQLVGDIAEAVTRIESQLSAVEWDLERVRDAVAAQRVRVSPPTDSLSPHDVVRLAAAASGGAATVTVDAGAHMFPATMLWPVAEPNQMLISNGLSTMGFAVPAAIGAALADRDRPIVALVGDGGLLMCLGDLLTIVRERLRVIVVVFSDGSLSLIDIKQQQRRYVSSGVSLGEVGWASIAESFRMPGHVATTEDELALALLRAFAHRGPSLIDARIDPGTYAETLRAIRG